MGSSNHHNYPTTTAISNIQWNKSAAITNRYISRNCGHDLGDEAFAVYRLRRLFSSAKVPLSHFFLNSKPTVCDKVLQPMAEHPILYAHGGGNTNTAAATMPTNTSMCFSNLYLGTSSLNYMADMGTYEYRQATLEDDMKAFRDLYYKRAGITPVIKIRNKTTKAIPRRMDTLLIMEKRQGSHMSNIHNRQASAEYLQTEFPDYNVAIVAWSELEP